MPRAVTACDQCGQADDHPKVHLGPVTKHHDCLSVAEEQMLCDSGQTEGAGPKASAIIKACKEGARGDKLLALIRDPKALPQAEGFHHKAMLALAEGGAK